MSVRLYVGNLPFEATGDDLREIFATIGQVDDAIVINRPRGGRPRGFGFVTMTDAQEADQAIAQLDGHELAGRAMKVNVAKGRDENE